MLFVPSTLLSASMLIDAAETSKPHRTGFTSITSTHESLDQLMMAVLTTCPNHTVVELVKQSKEMTKRGVPADDAELARMRALFHAFKGNLTCHCKEEKYLEKKDVKDAKDTKEPASPQAVSLSSPVAASASTLR